MRNKERLSSLEKGKIFSYFSLLGLAFMFIEMGLYSKNLFFYCTHPIFSLASRIVHCDVFLRNREPYKQEDRREKQMDTIYGNTILFLHLPYFLRWITEDFPSFSFSFEVHSSGYIIGSLSPFYGNAFSHWFAVRLR